MYCEQKISLKITVSFATPSKRHMAELNKSDNLNGFVSVSAAEIVLVT